MNNILSTRQSAAEYAINTFGVKPSFYRPEDIALLERILLEYGISEGPLGVKYNPNTLHTYHPGINVPPLPDSQAFRQADRFGFMRLNASQTFCRPHLQNVKSCHRFNDPPAVRAPFGNINYISNPAWATYGMYKKTASKAEFAYPTRITVDELELPNLVATVNVMLGYDEHGIASALFSRVYGVLNYDTGNGKALLGEPTIVRLVEYFQYRLGLRVYSSLEWLGTHHDLFGRQLGKKSSPPNRHLFVSPHMPVQITGEDPQDATRQTIIYRYPDISKALTRYDDGAVFASEKHVVSALFSNKHISPCAIMTGSVYGSYLELTNYVPTLGFRPGRDQIMCCVKCAATSETGKVQVVHYQDYGPLCANCASQYMVYSSSHGIFIKKEEAVRVAYGGRAEFLHMELDKNLFVPLTCPDSDTGAMYARREWTELVSVINLPEDVQTAATIEYRTVTSGDMANIYLLVPKHNITSVAEFLENKGDRTLCYAARDHSRFKAWLEANALVKKVSLVTDGTAPVFPISMVVEPADIGSTAMVRLSDGGLLQLHINAWDDPHAHHEPVLRVIQDYLAHVEYVVQEGINDCVDILFPLHELHKTRSALKGTDIGKRIPSKVHYNLPAGSCVIGEPSDNDMLRLFYALTEARATKLKVKALV